MVVGRKETEIEQLALVDSAALHVLLAANSAAFDPPIATPEICKDPPPEFLSVMDFGALVVPLGVLEKLSEDGETDSFGAVWASAVGTSPAHCNNDSSRATRTDQTMKVAVLIESIATPAPNLIISIPNGTAAKHSCAINCSLARS